MIANLSIKLQPLILTTVYSSEFNSKNQTQNVDEKNMWISKNTLEIIFYRAPNHSKGPSFPLWHTVDICTAMLKKALGATQA